MFVTNLWSRIQIYDDVACIQESWAASRWGSIGSKDVDAMSLTSGNTPRLLWARKLVWWFEVYVPVDIITNMYRIIRVKRKHVSMMFSPWYPLDLRTFDTKICQQKSAAKRNSSVSPKKDQNAQSTPDQLQKVKPLAHTHPSSLVMVPPPCTCDTNYCQQKALKLVVRRPKL